MVFQNFLEYLEGILVGGVIAMRVRSWCAVVCVWVKDLQRMSMHSAVPIRSEIEKTNKKIKVGVEEGKKVNTK